MKIFNADNKQEYEFPDDISEAEISDFFYRTVPESRKALSASVGGHEAALPIMNSASKEAARMAAKRANAGGADLFTDPITQIGGTIYQTLPNIAQAVGGVYESLRDYPSEIKKDLLSLQLEDTDSKNKSKTFLSRRAEMLQPIVPVVETVSNSKTFALTQEELADSERIKAIPEAERDELHKNRLKELSQRELETAQKRAGLEAEYRQVKQSLQPNNALLEYGMDLSGAIRAAVDRNTSVAGSVNPDDPTLEVFGVDTGIPTGPRKLFNAGSQVTGSILSILLPNAVVPGAGLIPAAGMAYDESRHQIEQFSPEMSEYDKNNLALSLTIPSMALEYGGALGTAAKGAYGPVVKKAVTGYVEKNAGLRLSAEAMKRIGQTKIGQAGLAALASPVSKVSGKALGALAPEVVTELLQETQNKLVIEDRFPTFDEYAMTAAVTAIGVGQFNLGRKAGSKILAARNKEERANAVRDDLPASFISRNRPLVSKYILGEISTDQLHQEFSKRGFELGVDGPGRGEFDVQVPRGAENATARLSALAKNDPFISSFFLALGEEAKTDGVFGEFAVGNITLEGFYKKLYKATQFGDFEGFTKAEKDALQNAMFRGDVLTNLPRASNLSERKLPSDRALPIINALRRKDKEGNIVNQGNVDVALEMAELILYNLATNTVIPGDPSGATFSSVAEYVNHPSTAINFDALLDPIVEATIKASVDADTVLTDQEAATKTNADDNVFSGRFEWRNGDADLITLTMNAANGSTLVHELQHLMISRLDENSPLASQLIKFLNNQQDDYLIENFSEITDRSSPEAAKKATRLQEIAAQYTEVFMAADITETKRSMNPGDVKLFRSFARQMQFLYNFNNKIGTVFESLGLIKDANKYVSGRKDRNSYFEFLVKGGNQKGAFTARHILRAQEQVVQDVFNPDAEIEVEIEVPDVAVESFEAGPEQGPITPLSPPAVTDVPAGNKIIRQKVKVQFPQESYGTLYRLPELLKTTGFEDVEGQVFDVSDKVAAARRKQNTKFLQQLAQDLGIPYPATRNLSAKKRDQARREFISKMLAVHKAYKELVDARTADNAARQGRDVQFHLQAPVVDGEVLSAAAEAGGIDLVDHNYYQKFRKSASPVSYEDPGRAALIQQNWRYSGPKLPIEVIREQAKTPDEELILKQLEKRLANGQPFDKAVNGMFNMFIDWHSPVMNQTMVEMLGRASGMQGRLPVIDAPAAEDRPYYQTVKVGKLLEGTKVVDSKNGLPKKVYPRGIFWAENPLLPRIISDRESAAYLNIKNPVRDTITDYNSAQPALAAAYKAAAELNVENADEFVTNAMSSAQIAGFMTAMYSAYESHGLAGETTNIKSPQDIMLHLGIDGIIYKDSRTSEMWRPMSTSQIHYVEEFEAHAENFVSDFEVLPQKQREAALKRVIGPTVAVDSRGVPVRTAHGTGTPGFPEHSAKYIDSAAGGDPFGYWYTEDIREAQRYLDMFHDGKGEIRQAYGIFQNPADLDKLSVSKVFYDDFVDAYVQVVSSSQALGTLNDFQSLVSMVQEAGKYVKQRHRMGSSTNERDNHRVREEISYLNRVLLEAVGKDLSRQDVMELQLVELAFQKLGYDGATHMGWNGIRKWVHFSNATLVPAAAVERQIAELEEIPNQPYYQKIKRKRLDGRDPLKLTDVAEAAKALYGSDSDMIDILTRMDKNERLNETELSALRLAQAQNLKRYDRLIKSGNPEIAARTAAEWKASIDNTLKSYVSEGATLLRMQQEDYRDILKDVVAKLRKTKGMKDVYYQLLSVLDVQDLVIMDNLKGHTKKQLEELLKTLEDDSFELKGMQRRIVENLSGMLTSGEELNIARLNNELAEFIALNNSNDTFRHLVRAARYGSMLLSIPGRAFDIIGSQSRLLWEMWAAEPVDVAADFAWATVSGKPRVRSFKELLVAPNKSLFERKRLTAPEFGEYADSGAIQASLAVLSGRLSTRQADSRYINDLRMGGAFLPETLEQYGTSGQRLLGSILALSPRIMSAIDIFYRVSSEEVYAEKMAARFNMWQEQGTFDQNLRSAAEQQADFLGHKGDNRQKFISAVIEDPMLLVQSLAEDFSAKIVFRQKPGAITDRVMKLRDSVDDTAAVVPVLGAIEPGRAMIPFIPTLVNLMKFGMANTPIAGAAIAAPFSPGLAAYMVGAGILGTATTTPGASFKQKAATYAKNQLAANTVLYFMYWALANGLLTAMPLDDDETRAWENDPTGKRAFAFKVKNDLFGLDTWVPIPPPFDLMFGPALIATRMHLEAAKQDMTPEQHRELGAKSYKAAEYLVKNNMFFSQAIKLYEAGSGFTVSRMAESYIPFNAMLRDISKWAYVDTKKDPELLARLGLPEEIATSTVVVTDKLLGPDAAAYLGRHTNHFLVSMGREPIPGLENGIPDSINYMGKDIVRQKFMGIGMPWEWFAESPDLTELPWEAEWKGLGIYPDTPSQNMQIDNETYRLTPDVYRDYTLRSGELLVERYNRMLSMPFYQRLSNEQKVKLFDKTYREVKTQAKQQIVSFHRLNTPEGKKQMVKLPKADLPLPI